MNIFQGSQPTVHAAINASLLRTLFAEVGTHPPLIQKDEFRSQRPHSPPLPSLPATPWLSRLLRLPHPTYLNLSMPSVRGI